VNRKPKPISRPRRKQGRKAYQSPGGQIESRKEPLDVRRMNESAVLFRPESVIRLEIETGTVNGLLVQEAGLGLRLEDVEAESRDLRVLLTLIGMSLARREAEAVVEKVHQFEARHASEIGVVVETATATETETETGIETGTGTGIERRIERVEDLGMMRSLAVEVAHAAGVVEGTGVEIETGLRLGAEVAVRM
jgi:hypothetical protein